MAKITVSDTSNKRASSPPPHLIGQIVEMGYSIDQARVALAATDTGEDVQVAMEILLSGGIDAIPASSQRSAQLNAHDDGWGEEAPRRRFNYDEDDDSSNSRLPPRRQTDEPRRPSMARTNSSSRDTPQDSYQQQADKIITQASEIGLSVFNRANALWKQGKEQAKKAYEERAANLRAGPSTAVPNGKPRWMQEHSEREESSTTSRRQDMSTFKDDDLPSDQIAEQSKAAPRRPKPQNERQPAQPPVGDLFSDTAPKVYRSPYRRDPPVASSLPSTPPRRPPSPVALVQRKTIPASSSAISSSNRHKNSGTEMFKLGRYAEAETSYSAAISELPDGHLLIIPLLNNRAISRIKTGNTTGAVEDCTTVIDMIGAKYHPTKEAKITQEDHGAGVNLSESLVKAWRRRAEAYEAKEKWDLARQDWEAIIAVDFSGATRRDAITGAARCRQVASASQRTEAPNTAPKPKPKPKPVPSRPPLRGPTPPSEALTRLKQANQDAEAEDQERHALKDSVDARLIAWKGGKETNIRALISSLDTVLWPELGWQKVTMAELLTPNQVKIRYTKAIAKLHPDKVRDYRKDIL
jgi:tetratricopeptide (TPR) repeat protein